MKKKITVLVLSLMLTLPLCSTVFATGYDDPYDDGSTGGYEQAETGQSEEQDQEQAQEQETESVEMHYIFDVYDLLDFDSWAVMEEQAEAISSKYGCGVYVAIIDSYTNYGTGDDVYDVTTQIYHGQELGEGDDRSGIILLMSMEERKYALFVYGSKADYAFTDYGLEKLEAVFLDDFGEDDWDTGFSDYLNECDRYLALAAEGKPVKQSAAGYIFIAVIISCIIAIGICIHFKNEMKSVYHQVYAGEYISAGGLNLTQSTDQYTHTTETRVRIDDDDSDSRSCSGGGGRGRSGSF